MLGNDAFSFWAPKTSFGGRHIQRHFLPSLSMFCFSYFIDFDVGHAPLIGVLKVRVGVGVVLGSLLLHFGITTICLIFSGVDRSCSCVSTGGHIFSFPFFDYGFPSLICDLLFLCALKWHIILFVHLHWYKFVILRNFSDERQPRLKPRDLNGYQHMHLRWYS